jgi:hypothetical protein
MEPIKEEDIVRVKQAVEVLAEHFDAVQIFVNRYEPSADPEERGMTEIATGAGNYYARFGQVKAWTVMQEGVESVRNLQRND